ncbi:MAG: Crp/Fnr family transcriptional regulator [Burkholderiaceae bacterium]
MPAEAWARLRPQLESITVQPGDVLCQSGHPATHVYFPTTAIVSLLHTTREGASAEIAIVGCDGVVGISLFMGGNFMMSQAIVNSAGDAWRLSAHAAMAEFARAGQVQNIVLRYTQSLIEHVAQIAACNRHHSIAQQLSRRLLDGLDRSASDKLFMTQEMLANLLGVRREGVTAAAVKLQDAGVIRYRRGRIDVLDRERLEQCACECYAVTRKTHDRLLPAMPAIPAVRAAIPAVRALPAMAAIAAL